VLKDADVRTYNYALCYILEEIWCKMECITDIQLYMVGLQTS